MAYVDIGSVRDGPLHYGAQRAGCVYEPGRTGGRPPHQVDASVRVAASPLDGRRVAGQTRPHQLVSRSICTEKPGLAQAPDRIMFTVNLGEFMRKMSIPAGAAGGPDNLLVRAAKPQEDGGSSGLTRRAHALLRPLAAPRPGQASVHCTSSCPGHSRIFMQAQSVAKSRMNGSLRPLMSRMSDVTSSHPSRSARAT